MLQGTSSHVGKSVLTAALCRLFRDKGLNVAPFKAQNMALNSCITKDGSEIGRAQAFQAEAAGIEPSADMNPVLLKPTGDSTAQVIIQGRVFGVMSAVEYHCFKKKARPYELQSFERLSKAYDVIVMEGAGSPAEINLRENDIANMGAALMADSPVILIGDIDRGGVLASLVGTMELLTAKEKRLVHGFIINKFRGDRSLLQPGLEFLEKRTKLPVLGVVPYMDNILIDEEDSLSLRDCSYGKAGARLLISVIRLPRISNFTDFDPFKHEPQVELRFIDAPEDVSSSDLVIIPGTKNTIADLEWLKKKRLFNAIRGHYKKGNPVIGICGGLQMLGKSVVDPHCVESKKSFSEGLGLLDGITELKKTKRTYQVMAEARLPFSDELRVVKGYEVHMGETSCKRPFARIFKRGDRPVDIADGGICKHGLAWGTYIHGIFDNDKLRRSLIDYLQKKKGVPNSPGRRNSYSKAKEAALNRLARVVEKSLDMKKLYNILGLE